MTAQWERADPAKHDYDERWPYAQDGYLKVYVHRTIKSLCERCGCEYPHFFVSHADWRKVPLPFRSMQLCVGCYVAVSG